MDARGRSRLETEMLPQMRQLDMTEAQLDEGLRARGLERRSITVPGHLGDPIALAVIQRIGRTGTAACAYAIHGGGMMFGHHLGNLDSYDDWLLVHDVVLVSPDYRLAPEHPDPYPVEDCYAGLVWVAEHADELGVDPERIVLVGQSAGAGLAAGTALLARDRQGPAVVGQVLVSPMLDDRDATVSARQFDGVGRRRPGDDPVRLGRLPRRPSRRRRRVDLRRSRPRDDLAGPSAGVRRLRQRRGVPRRDRRLRQRALGGGSAGGAARVAGGVPRVDEHDAGSDPVAPGRRRLCATGPGASSTPLPDGIPGRACGSPAPGPPLGEAMHP